MRRLSLGRGADGLRARRWDVLVLGGALPGLAAAVRLGMAGLRVALVEEEAARDTAPLLREPFFLTAARQGGVVHEALRVLGVPLIERRSLVGEEIALQVLLPEARPDVGSAALTADELVAWGLAKPETARELVRGLVAASEAECEVLREGSVVRRGARHALARGGGRRLRGLPALAADPPAELAPLLRAQLDALSNLGRAALPPEAAARLLGSVLEGGAFFERRGLTLRGLLRRRIEALHGEFRAIATPFEMVEVGGHPGIAGRGGEAWLGRALLVNAPGARLAGALRGWDHEVPGFLDGPAPAERRAALQLRVARDALPEALARRAILVPEAGPVVRLAVHPSEGDETVELVASTRVADDPDALEPGALAIEAAVRGLLPFGAESLRRSAAGPRPRWDDDAVLAEPAPERGWPAETELRRSARPPVHVLAREGVAALGVEGDLLLGCQAGDAIAAELAG